MSRMAVGRVVTVARAKQNGEKRASTSRNFLRSTPAFAELANTIRTSTIPIKNPKWASSSAALPNSSSQPVPSMLPISSFPDLRAWS
jgi:hypothetical protein